MASSYQAGRFFFVRPVYRAAIYCNMASAKQRSKGPRSEHPRLVGFSNVENALVERAARQLGEAGNTFIREAALFQAREELGLKHPAGE